MSGIAIKGDYRIVTHGWHFVGEKHKHLPLGPKPILKTMTNTKSMTKKIVIQILAAWAKYSIKMHFWDEMLEYQIDASEYKSKFCICNSKSWGSEILWLVRGSQLKVSLGRAEEGLGADPGWAPAAVRRLHLTLSIRSLPQRSFPRGVSQGWQQGLTANGSFSNFHGLTDSVSLSFYSNIHN